MDFEDILSGGIREGMGAAAYTLAAKARAHISKEKLDANSNAFYLNTGESKSVAYNQLLPRYIAAPGLTFDIAVSVFDVNSKSMLVLRSFALDRKHMGQISGFARSFKARKPMLEMRIIGMQNKQGGNQLSMLADAAKSEGIRIVEVDLFGANIRHIAFDSKLGVSHNILMENRIYRPGELANQQTLEMFERSLKLADPGHG